MAALRRAARMAREKAIETDTEMVIVEKLAGPYPGRGLA